MSVFEHHRFEIWNQTQHPFRHTLTDFTYANTALPGVTNANSALDWVIAVLYPNQKAAVATPAALPAAGNTIYDYRVVTDDGDGKSAAYRWEQREGDATAKWYKIYDMDFGAGSVLQQYLENTQDLFVQKYGMDDLDSTGVAVTGTYAGQTVYGGRTASTNLTLKANSGDGVGASTGFVQVADHFRPDANNTLDLGSTANEFRNLYLAGFARIGTNDVINAGSTEGLTNLLSSTTAATTIRGIASKAQLTTNTSNGSAAMQGALIQTQRTGSANVSETSQIIGVSASVRIDLTAASTYTNTGTNVSAYTVGGLGNLQACTLAVSNYSGIFFSSDTGATGTRKQCIQLAQWTGATNNALISDNAAYTGNYFINSVIARKSLLSGNIGFGSVADDTALNLNPQSLTSMAGTTRYGVKIETDFTSAATTAVYAFYSNVTSAAGGYTLPLLVQYWATNATKGASSTVTTQIHFGGAMPTQGGTANAFIATTTSFSGNYFIYSDSTNEALISGSLRIATAGKGLLIKEGSNATMGTVTLNGTTAVTVSTNKLTTTSRIFITTNTPGGTVGTPYVFTRVNGTSFDVKSTNAADTSTAAWVLFEPA